MTVHLMLKYTAIAKILKRNLQIRKKNIFTTNIKPNFTDGACLVQINFPFVYH